MPYSRLPPAGPADGEALRRRLSAYRALAFAALAAAAASGGLLLRHWRVEHADFPSFYSAEAPKRDEIEALLEPLRYSALPAILRPEVRLELDFARRQWRLKNLRRLSSSGEVLLDEGRYGACGELAAYAYQRVRRILDRRYAVQMVRAAESSYFPPGRANHFALLITDLERPGRSFVLDPSFKRYGPIEDFKDYVLYRADQNFHLLAGRQTDAVNPAGGGTPILIRKRSVIAMAVAPVGDRFDAENHALVLMATRRHQFAGDDFLTLKREGGRKTVREDRAEALEYLGEEEYRSLRRRVEELFDSVAVVAEKAK